MNPQMPGPLSDYHAATQRFASLLVAITAALGEPGDTLFGDLPRLVGELRAQVAALKLRLEPVDSPNFEALIAELGIDMTDPREVFAEKIVQQRERIRELEDQCRQWDAGFQRQKESNRDHRAQLRTQIAALEVQIKDWKGMYRVAVDRADDALHYGDRTRALIRHLLRSRRRWQGEAFEHLFTYSLENTERVDTQRQLDAASARIEVLLAKRNPDDEVLVEGSWFHPDDLPEILGNYMRSSDQHAREAKDALIELREARRWAAWFAAERDYIKRALATMEADRDLYHTVAVQNYENDGITMASLDAERTELQARIAELEAELAKANSAAGNLLGAAVSFAREADQPPTEPDAYIAVKRYFAVSAEGPEWEEPAKVFPAGEEWRVEREEFAAEGGWELLPIVADGDGTRFAAVNGVALELKAGAVYRNDTGGVLHAVQRMPYLIHNSLMRAPGTVLGDVWLMESRGNTWGTVPYLCTAEGLRELGYRLDEEAAQ